MRVVGRGGVDGGCGVGRLVDRLSVGLADWWIDGFIVLLFCP